MNIYVIILKIRELYCICSQTPITDFEGFKEAFLYLGPRQARAGIDLSMFCFYGSFLPELVSLFWVLRRLFSVMRLLGPMFVLGA